MAPPGVLSHNSPSTYPRSSFVTFFSGTAGEPTRHSSAVMRAPPASPTFLRPRVGPARTDIDAIKDKNMKKRIAIIAGAVSVALTLSACTTNPYTGESEVGKSGIGAGLGAALGAGVGVLSSSKKDRGKGALIGAAAGAALGGGAGYYMDVQEAKLRDKMKGTGVSVTRQGDNIVLNMPNNVTFDSSSATLKPAGANTLTGVAMVLKEYPKTAVNVVGYTDSTGSRSLNMNLSQQRADGVASALITQGVAANRIRTAGAGPDNPIASNSTAEGKAQNRRVEITLSPLQ